MCVTERALNETSVLWKFVQYV